MSVFNIVSVDINTGRNVIIMTCATYKAAQQYIDKYYARTDVKNDSFVLKIKEMAVIDIVT